MRAMQQTRVLPRQLQERLVGGDTPDAQSAQRRISCRQRFRRPSFERGHRHGRDQLIDFFRTTNNVRASGRGQHRAYEARLIAQLFGQRIR